MIDDCGAIDESSEKSVGFVQEWINTYVFLSREFLFSFRHYFPLLVFLLIHIPISSCFLTGCEEKSWNNFPYVNESIVQTAVGNCESLINFFDTFELWHESI